MNQAQRSLFQAEWAYAAPFEVTELSDELYRGIQARDLRSRLSKLTPGRCSYLLKRLCTHGLIKKVGRRSKYYVSKLGRRLLVSAVHLRETVVLAKLSETHA